MNQKPSNSFTKHSKFLERKINVFAHHCLLLRPLKQKWEIEWESLRGEDREETVIEV